MYVFPVEKSARELKRRFYTKKHRFVALTHLSVFSFPIEKM